MFVYKRTETTEYVKKQPTFQEKYKLYDLHYCTFNLNQNYEFAIQARIGYFTLTETKNTYSKC